MINAKQELIDELNGRKIIAARIYHDKMRPSAFLEVGHSKEELTAFLNQLDFEYDNGFGCQELSGTVWLQKGEWLERWEYDGSEGWERRAKPKVPDYLK